MLLKLAVMRTLLLITLTALASLTARADIAFDTFGPGNAYNSIIGLNIAPALGQGAGAVFIPTITGSDADRSGSDARRRSRRGLHRTR